MNVSCLDQAPLTFFETGVAGRVTVMTMYKHGHVAAVDEHYM